MPKVENKNISNQNNLLLVKQFNLLINQIKFELSDKNLTKSEYNFIQPPAEVEPAKVKKIEQDLSSIISLNIFEALAVSLEVNDILLIDSIISRESNFVISICSTGLFRNDFLLCPAAELLFLFIKLLSN